MIKIAINGFGRIGRTFFRVIFNNPDYKIVAINDLSNIKVSSHLLKYDSIHGRFPFSVSCDDSNLVIENEKIPFFNFSENKNFPWKDLSVDLVIESTGNYLKEELAFRHIKSGAKKVIITAPPKEKSIKTIVLGVNHNIIEYSDSIVSNASCTTNCLAPMAKVIHENFGIAEGLMTTVHAVTATQPTQDGPSQKDLRGGRGAGFNVIPASTGAAKAVGLAMPELQGKLMGMAFRIPTADVSVVDLTVKTEKATNYDEICETMKKASESETLKGILGYTDEPVVSSDFVTDSRSSIFDKGAGIELNSNFFKLVSWYDNEWGYSNRVIDLLKHMIKGDR